MADLPEPRRPELAGPRRLQHHQRSHRTRHAPTQRQLGPPQTLLPHERPASAVNPGSLAVGSGFGNSEWERACHMAMAGSGEAAANKCLPVILILYTPDEKRIGQHHRLAPLPGPRMAEASSSRGKEVLRARLEAGLSVHTAPDRYQPDLSSTILYDKFSIADLRAPWLPTWTGVTGSLVGEETLHADDPASSYL